MNDQAEQAEGSRTPIRGRSPIEMMIDAACGRDEVPERRRPTSEETSLANGVAGSVLYHIDQMYPGMWLGVAKAARRSVRNTIVSEVEQVLMQAAYEAQGGGR